MLPRVAFQPPPPVPLFNNPANEALRYDHYAAARPRPSSHPSSSLAPQRYALPIHRDAANREGSRFPARNGYGSHAVDNEQILRRKTPGGTLVAGYDAWSTEPPASKHLILSGPSPSTGKFSAPSGTGSPAGMAHRGWQNQMSSQPSNALRPQISRRPSGVSNGNWTQFPPISNNPSIFDQVSMNYGPTYSLHNGTRVPTVLPAAYQYSPGPTASNSSGMPGPFWPNGAFEPYRPAAVRSLPYALPFHGRQGAGPLEMNGQVGMQQNWSNGPYNTDTFDRDYNPPSTAISGFHSESTMQFPPKFLYQQPLGVPEQQPLGYENYSYPSSDGQRAPTANDVRHRGHAQFKDKVFSWAHTVYIDLLAYLHQTKSGQYSRRNQGPLNSRPIYPRPPQHSATTSPLTRQESSEFPDRRNDEALHNVPSRMATHHEPGAGSQHSPFDAHGVALPIRQLHDSCNNIYHSQPWQRNSADFVSTPALRRSSTLANARSALEMLNNLCEQSNWVGGMLLAGCLEYGLEHYEQALTWYRKILELDSSHVEAMSNLAASLLCLNRREEAERYWLQAVKLRPRHFEAVEHLIGLLCCGHRGREAVGVIDYVERALRITRQEDIDAVDHASETSSDADRSSDANSASENPHFDYDVLQSPQSTRTDDASQQAGYGSSGYMIPASENGRILALVHAKGNMLYALGDVSGAAKAFEDAVLIVAGKRAYGIQGLMHRILRALANSLEPGEGSRNPLSTESLLLPPEMALQTSKLIFPRNGELPGLRSVPEGIPKKAAISTTSNSLLSLAKIFQDGLATTSKLPRSATGVADILALYYLSLSLQPSPSTANNVGILLASVQQSSSARVYPVPAKRPNQNATLPDIPGIVPGSGVALALAYYNYGLDLDARHAHLYTNLGSLLKDIGQLRAAIKMYEHAVRCDPTFDIALANLANAVKDEGRICDAIEYYKRAVNASPDFAEAVCGLANALNSVCDWTGRGGVVHDRGKRDRWHVGVTGELMDARAADAVGSGWMQRVVDIVGRQLSEGIKWGQGVLQENIIQTLVQELESCDARPWSEEKRVNARTKLSSWAGTKWEGARVVRLIERAMKKGMHQWYLENYVLRQGDRPRSQYRRPQLPYTLAIPTAPTVLPFHTFTCPLSAQDVRQISQRNALRISCSTLRAPWLPATLYPAPPPPNPQLNIGYVSSDFNNHPLAHLMQSVFGLHDPSRARAFCYATTPSDRSVHRQQIEREAPVFRDASNWSADRLVRQIVQDEIHILVNLNGYTRGARNEVFAARPAPIQMSFMGYNGTTGAEWCDYLLADEVSIPKQTLRPPRTDPDLRWDDPSYDEGDWVYSENIIFTKDTFFCCDHRQSGPDSQEKPPLPWDDELKRRWKMRKELFPNLSDDAVILGNFNQLYKIEPTIFRTWLRILSQVPNAVLWLLRFPDLGETNLRRTAKAWASEDVASRIVFTDVAPKGQHISRARVCDLFLDTPECNAHTTAADILWSGTPLLTLPRFEYKMCSRMAASILQGALPKSEEGRKAAKQLIAKDDDEYEALAVKLARGLEYSVNEEGTGVAKGRLSDLRRILYEARWTSALFDTRTWVRTVEEGYVRAWMNWVDGTPGHIWLD